MVQLHSSDQGSHIQPSLMLVIAPAFPAFVTQLLSQTDAGFMPYRTNRRDSHVYDFRIGQLVLNLGFITMKIGFWLMWSVSIFLFFSWDDENSACNINAECPITRRSQRLLNTNPVICTVYRLLSVDNNLGFIKVCWVYGSQNQLIDLSVNCLYIFCFNLFICWQLSFHCSGFILVFDRQSVEHFLCFRQ